MFTRTSSIQYIHDICIFVDAYTFDVYYIRPQSFIRFFSFFVLSNIFSILLYFTQYNNNNNNDNKNNIIISAVACHMHASRILLL